MSGFKEDGYAGDTPEGQSGRVMEERGPFEMPTAPPTPPSRIVSPPPPPHLKAHELPDDFNEVKSEPFKNSLRSLKQQRDEQEKLVEGHASLIAELDETLVNNRKEHRALVADLGRMNAALRTMVEGRETADDQS